MVKGSKDGAPACRWGQLHIPCQVMRNRAGWGEKREGAYPSPMGPRQQRRGQRAKLTSPLLSSLARQLTSPRSARNSKRRMGLWPTSMKREKTG